MSVRIAPSLLSADFSRLGDEVEGIAAAGADLIHLDIMDGHFVPNLTFGPPVVAALAGRCPIPMDAHLMVTDPDVLIPPLAAAEVSRLAVHVETVVHLHRTLAAIRGHGIEAGVALNPSTPLAQLDELFEWIDFVLVMSVNPGFGGQQFIPASVAKIRRLATLIGDRPIDISVDGGVSTSNARALVQAGATTLIAGSAVFRAPDPKEAIGLLRGGSQCQGETS